MSSNQNQNSSYTIVKNVCVSLVRKDINIIEAEMAVSQIDSYFLENILFIAKQHKTLGMFFRAIAHGLLSSGILSGKHVDQIVQQYEIENEKSVYLLHTSCEISFRLASKGIKHAILKGPWTRIVVYKEEPIRLFTDLDILVDKCDLAGLNEVLESLGFVCGKYDKEKKIIIPSETFTKRKYMLLFSHPASYVRLSGNPSSPTYVIEPHYDLSLPGKMGKRIPNLPSKHFLSMVSKHNSSYGYLYGLSDPMAFIATVLSIYKDAKSIPSIKTASDCRMMKLCDLRELLNKLSKEELLMICSMANKYRFVKQIKLANEYLKVIYNENSFNSYMSYLDNEKVNIDAYGDEEGVMHREGGVWCQPLIMRYFNPRRVELLPLNKKLP